MERACLVKGIILGLYNDFSCLAGNCNYTCCSGWRIAVSGKDFDRFKNIKDQALRNDILSNIYEAGGRKYFATKSGGRCSMLDSGGLCHIQKNAGEGMLCNTCRKFPRLVSKHNGLVWISMAASCPVTSDYIVNKEIEFYMLGNNGDISVIQVQNIPFIAGGIQECTEIFQKYMTNRKTGQDYINMYKLFMEIADNVLGVIIENRGIIYLEGCFDYFEEEKSAGQVISQFKEFDNVFRKEHGSVLMNYLKYRIFSRYLEMPEEKESGRKNQVFGEMALIYIVALSRYFTFSAKETKRGRTDLETIINWVYRLCVHSLSAGIKLHDYFNRQRRKPL